MLTNFKRIVYEIDTEKMKGKTGTYYVYRFIEILSLSMLLFY